MKMSDKLDKWIEGTVSDGVFKNGAEALDVMAALGIEMCELFGVNRHAIDPKALPLTLEKLDVCGFQGKYPITQEGVDNLMIHIIDLGKVLDIKSPLGQLLGPVEYFKNLEKEKEDVDDAETDKSTKG